MVMVSAVPATVEWSTEETTDGEDGSNTAVVERREVTTIIWIIIIAVTIQ